MNANVEKPVLDQPALPTHEPVPTKARPIVIVSHPRSGTHLTIDGLRHSFIETYRRQGFNQSVHELYINLDRLHHGHPYAMKRTRVAKRLTTCPKRVLIKTHCSTAMEQVDDSHRAFARGIIDVSDIVYVVRDVRSVLVSYMALRPLKFADSPRDIASFLRTEMDGGSTPAANWARHVDGWLDHPGVHVVKFEELRADYEQTMRNLGAKLGLRENGFGQRTFTKPRSIWENKLRRILGIQHCSSIDNLRMQIATKPWRESMSSEDLTLVRDQAGHVMERLGYKWS